jgi:hypothetical protein
MVTTFVSDHPEGFGITGYPYAVIQLDDKNNVVARHAFTDQASASKAALELRQREAPAMATTRRGEFSRFIRRRVAPQAATQTGRLARGIGREVARPLVRKAREKYADYRVIQLRKDLLVAQKEDKIRKLKAEISRLRA